MTSPDRVAASCATTPSAAFQLVPVVRGAARGFTVRLVGGIVEPLVGRTFPHLGATWLTVVAVIGFTWAAWPGDPLREQSKSGRALHGAAAALGSYLLVLPLVISAAGTLPWAQMGLTATTAVLCGAAAGAVVRQTGWRPAV